MKLFVIDFESAYGDDYTLSHMTTEHYVRSERFQTIGVGVIEPSSGKRKWFEHEQFKKAAAREDWSRIAVLCHHAHFDGLILSHHYDINPGFFFDTLSMANAIHGPGAAKNLAALGERYGIGVKGDEVIHAKGKHRADFTQAEWNQYGVYCLNDCDLTLGVFKSMLPEFSKLELELIDITIRMFTEPELELNAPLMTEFLSWERQRKQELLERIGADKSVLMSNDKFALLLREYGIEPQLKATRRKQKDGTYKESETFAFAKTDSFMQTLLEHPEDEIRWLAEARVGVKSTLNETRTERYLSCWSRGPMPVYLKYSPTHTHRWGGGDSMNWQNNQRVNKKKPWSGTIRKSVVAPKGRLICVADASQIEARMTGYLAGETWLVEAFAQGRDVYSEMASVFYNRTVKRKENPEDEFAGFVGKVGVLGFGFGMGWYKAALNFLAGPMGADPVVFGEKDYEILQPNGNAFMSNPKKVEMVRMMPSRLNLRERYIHCIVSEELVKRWRQKNKQISGWLWKHMEQMLAWMNEGVTLDYGQCGFPVPIPIRVFRHGWQLHGFNAMHYPGLEYDGKEYSYMGGKSGKERVRIHGPAATENIVQYIARCATAEAMVKYRREFGVPIKLMAHDEVLSLPREEEAQTALAGKIRIMKTSPAWAPGLPLDAEGDIGRVYGEIK